jgi:hypothetical protein
MKRVADYCRICKKYTIQNADQEVESRDNGQLVIRIFAQCSVCQVVQTKRQRLKIPH